MGLRKSQRRERPWDQSQGTTHGRNHRRCRNDPNWRKLPPSNSITELPRRTVESVAFVWTDYPEHFAHEGYEGCELSLMTAAVIIDQTEHQGFSLS